MSDSMANVIGMCGATLIAGQLFTGHYYAAVMPNKILKRVHDVVERTQMLLTHPGRVSWLASLHVPMAVDHHTPSGAITALRQKLAVMNDQISGDIMKELVIEQWAKFLRFGNHERLNQIPTAESLSNQKLYIWWTSEEECRTITGYLDGSPEYEYLPPYIKSEIDSRCGRAGRGRLWVGGYTDSKIKFAEVDDYAVKAAGSGYVHAISQSGGVVFFARHLDEVMELPGLVTDTDLKLVSITKLI